ncbi:MAG: hypothetical protein ACLVJ6_08230 [Merdibacter sp.]
MRIEKWMENEHCMLLHPQCTDSFEVCVSGNGIRQQLTLSAQNQWCAYVDELPMVNISSRSCMAAMNVIW